MSGFQTCFASIVLSYIPIILEIHLKGSMNNFKLGLPNGFRIQNLPILIKAPRFLEIPKYRESFREKLTELKTQIPANWNPHQKLEFMKVSI
jgi:hypothetical protein